MSNETEVNPVQDDNLTLDIGSSVTTAAISFLREETEQDRTAKARYQQQRSEELLNTVRPSFTVLHTNNLQGVAQAAGTLGFSVVPVARTAAKGEQSVQLKNGRGERLTLHLNNDRVVVGCDAGRIHASQAVIRQNTILAATQYFNKLGGKQVQARPLANGDLELRATEVQRNQLGGAATITARIRKDATIVVDIDGVRGNRCDKVLQEFVREVGAEVKAKKLKPSYHQIVPGEPARLKTGR